MSKDRELLEAFYKESGIHHIVSESTYNSLVERFLASRPEEKEGTNDERKCGRCIHFPGINPLHKMACEMCHDFINFIEINSNNL